MTFLTQMKSENNSTKITEIWLCLFTKQSFLFWIYGFFIFLIFLYFHINLYILSITLSFYIFSPMLLQFLGFHNNFLQRQRFYFRIIYKILIFRMRTSKWCHTWYNHYKHPSISKMRSHLFNLDFLKTTYSLM